MVEVWGREKKSGIVQEKVRYEKTGWDEKAIVGKDNRRTKKEHSSGHKTISGKAHPQTLNKPSGILGHFQNQNWIGYLLTEPIKHRKHQNPRKQECPLGIKQEKWRTNQQHQIDAGQNIRRTVNFFKRSLEMAERYRSHPQLSQTMEGQSFWS